MAAKGLIGALVAGAIGAAVWAAIAHFANLEIGWIAWGIGLIVGLGSLATGGRGQTNAIACAAVAAGAIIAGKFAAVALVGMSIDRDALVSHLTADYYEEIRTDAEAFAHIRGAEGNYRRFMYDHNYTEARDINAITSEELDEFKAWQVPRLTWFIDNQPDFKAWQDHEIALIDEVVSEFNSSTGMTEMVKANLGLFDILFFALGIGTAWKIGLGNEE